MAQRELHMDLSVLEKMKKPELLSDGQWADVLRRKERLESRG